LEPLVLERLLEEAVEAAVEDGELEQAESPRAAAASTAQQRIFFMEVLLSEDA
jgi:hypothetical protein